NRRRGIPRGSDSRRAMRHNDVNPDVDQLRRESREAIEPALRPTGLDYIMLAFDITQIGESLPEQIETGRRHLRTVCPEDADSSRLARWLRRSSMQRKRQTDGKHDREPDPPH